MKRVAILLATVLFLTLSALFLWRPPDRVHAQGGPVPICDVTCSPDPDSGTYAVTIAARPKLPNARGLASTMVPREPRRHADSAMSVLLGSESYNYAVRILNLPGRNSLDLNLALYYNSRV